MPTGTYPKFSVYKGVLPAPAQFSARARPLRRSRTLILGAVVIFCSVIYFFRSTSVPGNGRNLLYGSHSIGWSRYAYSQYATDSAYLCNSIMVFEALHRFGSQADRILFYPEQWDTEIASSKDRDSQLLVMARDKYRVRLHPIRLQGIKEEKEDERETWNHSITKFLAFNQTQYDRILHLDSDITLLQHLDDLFLLPHAPVAMTRAYWELPHVSKLTSLLILLEPSTQAFDMLIKAAQYSASASALSGTQVKLDMEVLNDVYGDSALVLPHRPFALLTGEFRSKDHSVYLGPQYIDDEWDPDAILKEARLVHFSDWPLPKPWVMWPQQLLAEMIPRCKNNAGTKEESGCRDREIWKGLYDDFRQRRKVRDVYIVTL